MNSFQILKQEIIECRIRAKSDETVQVLNYLQEFAENNLNNGWISVDDGLPSFHDMVLVYGNFCYITTAELSGKGKWDYSELMPYDSKVTHWQPLPQPPKE